MRCSIALNEIRQPARLLFTLLDAIENDGLISVPRCQTRWREGIRAVPPSLLLAALTLSSRGSIQAWSSQTY